MQGLKDREVLVEGLSNLLQPKMDMRVKVYRISLTQILHLSSRKLEWHVGIEPTYTRFAVCRLASQPVPRGVFLSLNQSMAPKKNPYINAVCSIEPGPNIIASTNIIGMPMRYLQLFIIIHPLWYQVCKGSGHSVQSLCLLDVICQFECIHINEVQVSVFT